MNDNTQFFWSAATNGFYSSDIHDTVPPDAIPISNKLRQECLDKQSEGGVIMTGEDGLPTTKMPAKPTQEDLREIVRGEVRRRRATVLSRLDGLQTSAVVNADTELAKAIEGAKQALRDLPASAFAGKTVADMLAGAEASFKAIAETAPPAVRLAFAERA